MCWNAFRNRCGYRHSPLLDNIYAGNTLGPKSEKLNPVQRLLFGLTEQPAMLPTPPSSASGTGGNRRKRHGGRRTPPQNLPVHRNVIDLPEEQKSGLVKIREEITEQIECTPSQFYRRQIVRPVYASRERAHAPIVAALPPHVIPQAGVSPGFITHVVISKYVDHIPLHRQESMDAPGGVWIGRQARCRYVEGAAHLLITIH